MVVQENRERRKAEGMDGEEEEPVTPAGRFFLQPDVEAIINCVIGLKLPIDIESTKAEICQTLLNHPRFCSILVCPIYSHIHPRTLI